MRQHNFTTTIFGVVPIDGVDSLARLRDDAIEHYQPSNSQELFAVERIALAQQTLLMVARIEVGMYSGFLSAAYDSKPFPLIRDEKVGGDHEVAFQQNNNILLAVGMGRLNALSKSSTACAKKRPRPPRPPKCSP